MDLKIDYPPDFAVRYGYGKPPAKHLVELIERFSANYSHWLSAMQGMKKNLAGMQVDGDKAAAEPFWDNGWFPPLDGTFIYTALAKRNPDLMIEIGSGNSTKFARKSILDHDLKTQIISIDPHPRAEIDDLSDEIVRSSLESADLSVFSRLRKGDFLFFDGSHRCFQNSDVTVFFMEILPALPKGVYVGVHDIYWPADYPATWKDRYYNEQYILGAYLLGAAKEIEIIFPSTYLTSNRQSDVQKALATAASNHFVTKNGFVGGTAFWFLT